MSIIISNSYLAVFSVGTLIGASSCYLFLLKYGHKYLNRAPTTSESVQDTHKSIWTKGMEERFEFDEVTDEYRLVMGVRNDLKMQKGKVAAQCGHAAVAAYAKALNSCPRTLKRWLKYGGTKIAVRVDSEQEMLELEKRAREMKVLASIIRDAGQTQVAPGTRTVIAIGPAPKSVLDKISGHLKLF